MPNMGASEGQAAGVTPRVRETWVHEKGLPRTSRDPLVHHLGRRILLATDLTDASRDVDGRAIELAATARAHLVILAVIPPQAGRDGSHGTRVRALVRRARRRGIQAEGRIRVGDPAETILRVAAATRADAIVIGHDQWRGSAAGGCVCGRLVLHAPCRVVICGGTTH